MKQLILTPLNQFSVVGIERFILPGGPGGRIIWGSIIQSNNLSRKVEPMKEYLLNLRYEREMLPLIVGLELLDLEN